MNLDQIQTIGILGDRNTGKTNLMFSIAKEYQGDRKIYFYGYPTECGYPQIHTIGELELLTDSIIFMDELQKHIKFYTKSTNEMFIEVLSVLAHNNNTLVFTTCMSQFITKSFDCFISGFIYTKIADMDQLKNGSKAKRYLQEFSTIRVGTRTLRLNSGEYMQIIDGQEQTNGLHTFENMGIGKDWKPQSFPNISPKIPQNFAKISPIYGTKKHIKSNTLDIRSGDDFI